MNAKNHGNGFITYTLIPLSTEFDKTCLKVTKFLFAEGHRVVVVSDQTLQKQNEDLSVFEVGVSKSDCTIVFSSIKSPYAGDILAMVRKVDSTYAIQVVRNSELPPGFPNQFRPGGFDEIIAERDVTKWGAKKFMRETLCNLARYQ